MPIPVAKLKNSKYETLKEKILKILKRNKKLSWNVNELAEKVNASKNSVRGCLRDLLKKGLVSRNKYNKVYYYFFNSTNTPKKLRKHKKLKKRKRKK